MENYPVSALKASEFGKAKLPLDYLQVMLAANAKVPGYITPDLYECVLELQNQRAVLVSLEFDYFNIVSGEIKKPETTQNWDGWCYKVFRLYESSRKWEGRMGEFTKWITEPTTNNMKEGSDIMDVCRSERGFLLDGWSSANLRFEQLFCYAMLRGVPQSDLKDKLKRYRESIPTFEKNLWELQQTPQNLQWPQPWISELKRIQTEIMNINGIRSHQVDQPLDVGVFDDKTRLRVFGHIICQDISLIFGEMEVFIEAFEKVHANELQIAQERAMYRY